MGVDLYEYVGTRIRELRTKFNAGQGLSQEALGRAVGVTANTISRWETATYHPTLRDLDKLSRFFGASISAFFPAKTVPNDEKVSGLLRAAKDLHPKDVEELRRFAEFRRAHVLYPKGRPSPGRKRRPRA